MAFSLRNEQRENLKILRERSSDDVVELCKLSFDYLTNGPNEKKYQLIAKKYNTNADIIQASVEALISLLIDATKANVTEAEFENLKNDGFSSDHISILEQFVSSKKNFIENSLQASNVNTYRLVDLQWRLECKIASRCLLNQSSVVITMKLNLHTNSNCEGRGLVAETNDGDGKNRKQVLLQTDPNNLRHLIDVLEQALLESKTRRVRNIVSAIQ